MASPFSGVVLAAGAALTSPTLYGAFVAGTVPIEDALFRLIAVVAVTTVAVTLVEWVFHGTSPMTQSQVEAVGRMREMGSREAAAVEAAPSPAVTAAGDGTAD